MQPWIDWARSHIQGIVAELQRQHPNLRCRVALVGYRDIGDTPQFHIVPYTDPETVSRELSTLRAFGGGDAAEDVFNGLRKVLALKQDAPTPHDITVLLHVCDAPCHGDRYHDILLSDAHPRPARTLYDGRKIEDLVKVRRTGVRTWTRYVLASPIAQLLASFGWDYNFIRINSTTDQMVRAHVQRRRSRVQAHHLRCPPPSPSRYPAGGHL